MEYAGADMFGHGRLADLYRALAHPVRLQILYLLAQREACVCHVTAVLGLRQPYVSQQLGVLRDAGLVVSRRDATLIYYRLRDARLAGLLALAESLVGAPERGAESRGWSIDDPVAGCQCPSCLGDAPASGCGHRVTADAAG